MAENRIFREIRCREMEQTLTSTVTISSGVVPLPAGYIDLKYAYLSNEQPRRFLKKRTASWIYERYPYRAASGRPLAIAREGTNFIFGPYADASSTYTIGGCCCSGVRGASLSQGDRCRRRGDLGIEVSEHQARAAGGSADRRYRRLGNHR
jgi:hypothetical protein